MNKNSLIIITKTKGFMPEVPRYCDFLLGLEGLYKIFLKHHKIKKTDSLEIVYGRLNKDNVFSYEIRFPKGTTINNLTLAQDFINWLGVLCEAFKGLDNNIVIDKRAGKDICGIIHNLKKVVSIDPNEAIHMRTKKNIPKLIVDRISFKIESLGGMIMMGNTIIHLIFMFPIAFICVPEMRKHLIEFIKACYNRDEDARDISCDKIIDICEKRIKEYERIHGRKQ